MIMHTASQWGIGIVIGAVATTLTLTAVGFTRTEPGGLGACCLLPGICVEGQTESQCTGNGGIWQGAGSNCNLVSCLDGACCFGDQCEQLTEGVCENIRDGEYQGDLVPCEDAECAISTAPCCFPNGTCTDLEPDDCTAAGGEPGTVGVLCKATECAPLGACCLPGGDCLEDVDADECNALDGVFQGPRTTCKDQNCPPSIGACCFESGLCLVLTEADCAKTGTGVWAGAGTDCTDADDNGVADACRPGSTCAADLNGDGEVGSEDLADLLAQWGPCDG